MSNMKKNYWHLRSATIIAFALLHIVIFGTRKKAPANPKNIAIVQGAKLGDMVCTTPLFRAIQRAYPTSRIIVIGDAVNQKLLRGHPAIARYIVWQKNFRATARALRRERIDYGLVALPSLESLALLVCGGARAVAAPIVIGGISPFETRLYSFLRGFAIAVPHRYGGYVPREYLRLLEPIGIQSDNTKKWLTVSKEAQAHVTSFFAEIGLVPRHDLLIGITPAVGGNPRKRWSPAKFSAVADYLAERYSAKIIVVGSGRDKDDIENMLRSLSPRTKIVNTLDLFSLDELKALIASFSLFISADTGPIYIAEAFDIPTIDIVGPMDENAQPPRGKLHRVVVPTRTRPAFGILNHDGSNPEEELRQSKATTVEMVCKVVDELVPLIRAHFSATT